jgi:hypothetical protein
MRPEKAEPVLVNYAGDLPERDTLRAWAAFGVTHPRVPRIVRAERASSGRAKCRHCRETIDKGALRIALQMMEESRMVPIGFIHVSCALGYFGTLDVLDRLVRFTPGLSADDTRELEGLLAEGQRAPPEGRPGLAKVSVGEETPASERASR